MLPDYPISYLDPCPNLNRPSFYQSVYSCSSFPIEPYQQLYPFQSGTAQIFSATTLYDAEIIAGTDYAYFERVAYIDSSGNSYPAETFGSLLSGLTGSELSGTGNFIGYEGPGTFERENPTVYRINFDNYSESEVTVIVRITNLNDNTYSDWHTLIVNPDLRLVNQQYEADTLLHYYSKDVTPRFINANFPCSHPGYGGCPPDNVTFNIEIIEGQQYGSIKSGLTGDISTSFTGIPFNELYVFTYYANGLQPDSTAAVRIRHSSSDAEIIPMEFSFLVKKNNIPPPSEGGSIYVKLDKKVVIPGDTVDVQLRWIDEVGDTIDFLMIQRFRVDLAEGSGYGTILDIQTGDTADTFTEIGNMFKVIVEDQITPQEAKIIIVAEADLMIWSRPVRINNRDQDKENENSSEKVDDGGGITPDIIIIADHLVGVGEITITKTPFVVEIFPAVISAGDTALIVPKKKRSDGTLEDFPPEQTFEIGMLEGCALGLIHAGVDSLNYFYGVTQPIYFIAADSLEGESDTVKILVGLVEQQGNSPQIGDGDVSSDDFESPPGGEPTNPMGFACFNNLFISLKKVLANVVVGDEWCEDLDECTINNAGKKPTIEVIDLPNGYFGVDLCLDPEKIKKAESGEGVLGGYHEPCWSKEGEWIIFNPLYWLFIRTPDRQIYNDFELELCHDDYSNVVQFGITGDKLFFKSIVGFCGNLIELAEKTMINDTSEIRTKIPQDEQTLLSVFNDLETSKTYGKGSGLFYFTEITWAHELQHMENFKTQILKFYNDNYDFLNYSKFDVSCEEAGNINSVKNKMKQNYKNALNEYEKLVKIRYYEKYYGKNGENKEWNETTNTHNKVSVQSVIEKLQDKVADLLYELIHNNH